MQPAVVNQSLSQSISHSVSQSISESVDRLNGDKEAERITQDVADTFEWTHVRGGRPVSSDRSTPRVVLQRLDERLALRLTHGLAQ